MKATRPTNDAEAHTPDFVWGRLENELQVVCDQLKDPPSKQDCGPCRKGAAWRRSCGRFAVLPVLRLPCRDVGSGGGAKPATYQCWTANADRCRLRAASDARWAAHALHLAAGRLVQNSRNALQHFEIALLQRTVRVCRDMLRATRAAQPAAGGGGGETATLGKPGEALTFESLARAKGPQVSFCTHHRECT